MRPMLLALAMLALCSTTVPAGPNAFGAIIVHTNDTYIYSAGTRCTTPLGEPATCADAIVRTDKETDAVVWFLAAFSPTASPRVAVVYFGHDYDEENLDVASAGYGMCAPPGSLEAPDDTWPVDEASGTTVGFGTPIIGDTMFRFYYFRVDDFSGGVGNPFLCSDINPTGGYAAFFDDNFPAVQDNITWFGCVRWYADGQNPCECCGPPSGACCFPTGECVILSPNDCVGQGGQYMGDYTDCADTPCAQPGACCDPTNGNCIYVVASDCPASFVWHPEWTCVPNYCPLPVPTTPTTWGKIKANYR